MAKDQIRKKKIKAVHSNLLHGGNTNTIQIYEMSILANNLLNMDRTGNYPEIHQ